MKIGTPFRDGSKGWVSAAGAARRIPFISDNSDKKVTQTPGQKSEKFPRLNDSRSTLSRKLSMLNNTD